MGQQATRNFFVILLLLLATGCASVAYNKFERPPLQLRADQAGVGVGMDLFDWKTAMEHPWGTLIAFLTDTATITLVVEKLYEWYKNKYGGDTAVSYSPSPTTVVNIYGDGTVYNGKKGR